MSDEAKKTGLIHLDENKFKELTENSNDLYMIDFWAEWCGPCKVMNPYLEKIATLPKYEGELKIAKINTDENQNLASAFKITGIPCFIFVQFDSESKKVTELARIVGASDYISFVNKIDDNLKAIKASKSE